MGDKLACGAAGYHQLQFPLFFVGLQANINLNFLYFLMATAICGGVPPLAASITWARCSKFAAITGAHLFSRENIYVIVKR